MKRDYRLILGAFCLACLMAGFFAASAISSERFGEEPPILWDVLTVDFPGDGAALFAVVRDIVEERYTLMDVNETTGRMETAWLVEKETQGRLRFIIVVEPGIVHVGREIVSPPQENTADDVYGSMLFFFLDIANRERDKILTDIHGGLKNPAVPEE